MSGSTGPATRVGCRETRWGWRPASSRSPTCTRRYLAQAVPTGVAPEKAAAEFRAGAGVRYDEDAVVSCLALIDGGFEFSDEQTIRGQLLFA